MVNKIQGRKSQLLSIIEDYDEDFRGITATQLNKDVKLDKSTISYHLNNLENQKLVTSVKVGRKKFLDTTEKGSDLLEDKDITDPIKASCGNCGSGHSSFEEAKKCCTEQNEAEEE
jgi:DNA-binding transcriptional ArsR family regulator